MRLKCFLSKSNQCSRWQQVEKERQELRLYTAKLVHPHSIEVGGTDNVLSYNGI